MSRIEDELRMALRREEPSADFSDRVMARIVASSIETEREKQREKVSWRRRLAGLFHPPQVKWAMAGALSLLLIFAAFGVHRRREHQRALEEMAEGQRAKEQVMVAMKIASAKLNVAQKKVQDSGEK
jgi:hypothetical protein